MKRLLFVVNFLVLFVFLTITNVNAEECTTAELRELKNLAKKIQIVYSQQESDLGEYSFLVEAYNLNKNYYLNVDDYKYIFYISENVEVGAYAPGTTVNVSIYTSNLSNCKGELLETRKIILPVYNKYFESNECVGKENLDICKKWYDTSKMSEEKFKELVNKKTTEVKEKTFFDSLLSMLKQYGLIGLGAIVGIGLIVFVIIFIKNKKRTKIDL